MNRVKVERYNGESKTGAAAGQFQHSSCSSAQNSGDDEDSDARSTVSYKERRREAHTFAEQKRRDAIKTGYDSLRDIVPTCQQTDSLGASKISKALILQKSIDYVQYMTQQKKRQEENLERLRKDVMALKIMKANYEHIVKSHNSAPNVQENQLPDELKFRVFQQLMDHLFVSFDTTINATNFAELSASVFNWLEESCKPGALRNIMLSSLHQAQLN